MVEYNPLPDLPPVRRVVTGHCTDGKAIFEHDDFLTPVGVSGSHISAGFTLIHRTEGFPVTNQGLDDELAVENLQRSKRPSGIVCEIVDFPPRTNGELPLLHRNRSLDYGVILEGTINLMLDDGVERTLQKGDVFVQRYVSQLDFSVQGLLTPLCEYRGTIHAWSNVSNEMCRFLTVIIPAEEVIVKLTGEALAVMKIEGLTK